MEKLLQEVGTVTITLFPIIDILGALPIIIGIRKKTGTVHSEKSTFVAFCLMVTFLFAGQQLLNFMQLPIEAFAVAGSIVLFILALEMILGVSFHKDEIPESASIIPIAFPLIAGPGVLTTTLAMRSLYSIESILLGVVINMAIVYVVMKLASPIEKMLGKVGVVIIHKISGAILLAISIKLFADNWKVLL